MDIELESLQMLAEPLAADQQAGMGCGFTIGCMMTIFWTTDQW